MKLCGPQNRNPPTFTTVGLAGCGPHDNTRYAVVRSVNFAARNGGRGSSQSGRTCGPQFLTRAACKGSILGIAGRN
jgi:hypothetical protein